MNLPRITVMTSLYRGGRHLDRYLEALRAQTEPDRIEAVIVHNDPLPEDSAKIESFMATSGIRVLHLEVPLEGLYQSWNRAVRESSGEYIAIWNVDDVRLPDSLERQAHLLDSDPQVAATYGDNIFVREPGAVQGITKFCPEFDRRLFTTECSTGPFVMWRRSAGEEAGPFDEQFSVAGDFDLWIRLAARFPMRKTPGILGYFLFEGKGLSTCGDGIQPVERTAVELRYGITGRLDYRFVRSARMYDLENVHCGGKLIPVADLVPDIEERLRLGKRELLRGMLRDIRRRIRRGIVAAKAPLRRAAGRGRTGEGGSGC